MQQLVKDKLPYTLTLTYSELLLRGISEDDIEKMVRRNAEKLI
jgi:hypothetical protein